MEDTGEAFRTSSWMRSCTPFVQEKGESNLLGESNIMHFNREFMINLKETSDSRITNVDMFYKVMELLGKIPECKEISKIFGYAIPGREIALYSESYFPEVGARVNPGGSEGIYIDWYMVFSSDSNPKIIRIGTIKTLKEDFEAYTQLGCISGALICLSNLYLSVNDEIIAKQS